MTRIKYAGLAFVLFALISLVMKPSHSDLEASAIDKSPFVSLEENASYQHHHENQLASLSQTSSGEPQEPLEQCWPEPSYYRFDQWKAPTPSLITPDQPVSKKPLRISEDASRMHSLNGILFEAATAFLTDPAHQAQVLDSLEIVEMPSPEPACFSLILEAASYYEGDPSHQTGVVDTPEAMEKPSSEPTYFSLLLEAADSHGAPPIQTGVLDTPETMETPTSEPTYFSRLLKAAYSQGDPPIQTGALDTPETIEEPTSEPTYFSLLLNATASSKKEPPNQAAAKESQQLSEKSPPEPSFRPVLLKTLVAYGSDELSPSEEREQRERTEDSLSELPFHNIILEAAVTYQVDPALIKAVIMAESGYNPRAVSPRGARGLMQLMPRTAKSLGVKDSFDPFHNINGGVKYLRKLLDRFNGDVALALAAYNAGSRYVRKYKGVPPFKATRLYIKKVIKYLDIYRKELMEIPGVA